MHDVMLRGIGTALPEHSIKQHEAAEIAKTFVFDRPDQARLVPALFRRAQIRQRSFVLLEAGHGAEARQTFYPAALSEDDHGPSTAARMARYTPGAAALGETASRRALECAGLTAGQITHLVTVSCTGFAAPGVDVELIRRLGLPPTVQRVHVGFMGCHGAINGMRVARGLAGSDPAVRVLMCCVELCGLHFQYGCDPHELVANSLFSDGAAAVVLAPPNQAGAEGWRLAATGSMLMPDAEDAMTWRIGDHGFRMTLSPRVPDLIGQYLRPWLQRWLECQGIGIEQVGCWAVHPGGPRILSSVTEALGLPADRTQVSTEVLAECGNMSSPTVLFVIERLRQRGASAPCVALGFGPGLIAEVALFR